MKMMSMPRCGVKDKIGRSKRVKRYELQGSTWKTKHLKYRIIKYPSKLQRETVDLMIRKAFDLWSNRSELMFEPVTDPKRFANIEIKFVKGKHGDDSPFEGPGGVLGHAFFPESGGDIHFDDEESWTIDSAMGTNLLQVANHEIGHSLGLSHSDEVDAAMSPLYTEYIPKYMLHNDDIQAIQKLYGMKIEREQDPELPSDPTEDAWNKFWDRILMQYNNVD
ncbi:hypothetical protein HHI36_004421 [Cryptolaemus montrouzieri]